MQALVSITLPFELLVPSEAPFLVWNGCFGGYSVDIEPFARKKKDGYSIPGSEFEELGKVCIDGRGATFTNVLSLRFHADSFDRRSAVALDPPVAVVEKVLNSVLVRLRAVTGSPRVLETQLKYVEWFVVYCDDNGEPLAPEPELKHMTGAGVLDARWIAMDEKDWNTFATLPNDYKQPVWQALLIDARGALPHVGSSIALTLTALEVFISEVLQRMADPSKIPEELWNWIIRPDGDLRRQPSIENRYSVLLAAVLGRSLKEDSKALWSELQALIKARNSFVHGGVTYLDKARTLRAEPKHARRFITAAEDIFREVQGWMPAAQRAPEFRPSHKVEIQLNQDRSILRAGVFSVDRPTMRKAEKVK